MSGPPPDFVELAEDVSGSPLWNPDLAPTRLEQRTWSTYLSGVAAHEQEHVDDYEAEITRWAGEVADLRGEATGKDAKRAEAAAKAALGKTFKAAFTPADNTKRLKDSARKLDAGTGHGPVLKYKSSK